MNIVVIGLGYVGLPLAVELAKHYATTGFDIDERRISELREGNDRTGEIDGEALSGSKLAVTSDVAAIGGADFYIVTVPTPVDDLRRPDLSALEQETRMIAGIVDPAKRPTIVFESTVYPGVTEEVCGAILEEHPEIQPSQR